MGVAPAEIIFVVILSFEVALVSSPNIIIVTLKSKQTNFLILQSIGIISIKSSEKSQSSTPADILVDIVNPYDSSNGLN